MPAKHSYERLIYFGLWAVACLLLIRGGWTEIITLSGWDPDDQLRLAQLRDFLAGQSWFDTTQYRMNAPDGAPMHWSRLIELPLALFILLLRPIFGQAVAEMMAGTAVPLLLLGWIAFMLSRIAAHITSREAGVAATLITLSSGALLLQLRPMRIDHHGWQIAMAVLSLWTIYWAEARKAGLVLGLALAVWLHISLEGAPMTAAFFLFLGWRWASDALEGQRLFWTVASFALASTLLFFGTQAYGLTAATYCDTISPPHLAAIGLATIVMLCAIRFAPDDRKWRLLAGGMAGIASLAVLFIYAPQCVGGAFGDMDPLVREYWYVKVSEGLPIWHQPWRTAANLGAGLLCGAICWFALYINSNHETRRKLGAIGFFLFYGLLLSILVTRTISVATAYAIPVAGVLIASLFQQYRQSKIPVRRVGLVALMLIILVPGAAISSLIRAIPTAANKNEARAETRNDACESAKSVRALSVLAKGRFIAPFDMGPMILAQTPHMVLASSHHRNEKAMHDHIQIFRSAPDIAHRIMKERGINYLAACPEEAELGFYAKKDPAGLWAQISKRNAPNWLEPLPEVGKGIKVWRVR